MKNLFKYASVLITIIISIDSSLAQFTETVTINSKNYGPKLILNDPDTKNKVPIEFRTNNAIKWELGMRKVEEGNDLALWRYNGSSYYPTIWFKQGSGNVGIGTKEPKAKMEIKAEYGILNFTVDYPLTTGLISTIFPSSEIFNLDSKYVDPWHKIAGLFISSNSSNNYSNYGILAIGKSNSGTEAVGGSFGAYNLKDDLAIGVKITSVESPTGEAYSIYDESNAKSYFSGNMGIGTTEPGSKLTVALDGYPGVSVDNTPLVYFHQSSNPDGNNLKPALELRNGGGQGVGLVSIAKDNYFSGNICIGTANKTADLTIAGKISSREVEVTIDAGADFVFEENYPIKNIEEVEAYIKENKHLPEIASASEMEKNGIELGEMNIKLLQKVEELTLYLIEQNKKMKKVEAEAKIKDGRLSKIEDENKELKKLNSRLLEIEKKLEKIELSNPKIEKK